MKRSSQVALLLMGVTGVGAAAGGFMITRPQHCIPAGSPAAAAPAVPGAKALEPCPARRDWVWSGSNYSRSSSSSSWSRTNASSGSLWPVFSRRGTSATPSGSVPLSGRTAAAPGSPRASTSSPTQRSGFGSSSSSFSRASSS